MEKARKLITTHHKGSAGEHLVVFDFLVRGYSGMINPFPGSSADVIVDLGQDVIRIQVKATPQPRKTNNGLGYTATRYEFKVAPYSSAKERYGGQNIDLFAFVALDIRTVCYVPAKEILTTGRNGSKVFTRESFLAASSNSLDRYLSTL